MDAIVDKTLQALGFYISTFGFIEKNFLCFIDINDLKLTVEPAIVNNLSQVVTDFEKEIVK